MERLPSRAASPSVRPHDIAYRTERGAVAKGGHLVRVLDLGRPVHRHPGEPDGLGALYGVTLGPLHQGLQHLKLAIISLAPVGTEIVRT